MIVRLSNWLISTLRSYAYPAAVCTLRVGTSTAYHRVNLASLNADPSAGTITVVFVFIDRTTVRLSDSIIVDLFNFNAPVIASNVNVTIPSNYTWGQVALVDTITLIGAV
jgi:hypothetical protein